MNTKNMELTNNLRKQLQESTTRSQKLEKKLQEETQRTKHLNEELKNKQALNEKLLRDLEKSEDERTAIGREMDRLRKMVDERTMKRDRKWDTTEQTQELNKNMSKGNEKEPDMSYAEATGYDQRGTNNWYAQQVQAEQEKNKDQDMRGEDAERERRIKRQRLDDERKGDTERRERENRGDENEDKWNRILSRRRDRSRSRVRDRSLSRVGQDRGRTVAFTNKRVAFLGDSSLKIIMKEADVRGTVEKYNWDDDVRVYRGCRAEDIEELAEKDKWEKMDGLIVSMGLNNLLDVNKDRDDLRPRKDKINKECSTVLKAVKDLREWATSKKVGMVFMGPNYTDRLEIHEIEKLDVDMEKYAKQEGHHYVSRCNGMKKLAEEDDEIQDWMGMIEKMTTDGLHLDFTYEKMFIKEALDKIQIRDDLRNQHHRKDIRSVLRGRCWTCGERMQDHDRDRCEMKPGELCEVCGDDRHKEKACLSRYKMCGWCGRIGHHEKRCRIKLSKNDY